MIEELGQTLEVSHLPVYPIYLFIPQLLTDLVQFLHLRHVPALLQGETEDDIGIVIEVKYVEDGNLEAGCREALKQIQDKGYEEVLVEDGIETIRKYGIACWKKKCKVEVSA